MKNERKINLSIILSIVTLTITIGIIAIWCICVKDFSVVTGDTFISTCTGLISLALPIIIGYQIINSFDIKNSLKEAEEKNEKFKTETNNRLDSFKKDFDIELNKIREINKSLHNSLEIEQKERELIYQDMKVAIYHGKTIQNSALALYEQIDVVNLIIELERKEELKDNVILLVHIIKEIHEKDFYSIKSDNNKIVGLNGNGLFEINQYEKEIKIKIRNLPQINECFIESLILVEKSLDCKLQFLKKGSIGNIDITNSKIDEYLKQICDKL